MITIETFRQFAVANGMPEDLDDEQLVGWLDERIDAVAPDTFTRDEGDLVTRGAGDSSALRAKCIANGMPADLDNDAMNAWLILQMRVHSAATEAANKVAADYEARQQTAPVDPTIGTETIGGAVGDWGCWTESQQAEIRQADNIVVPTAKDDDLASWFDDKGEYIPARQSSMLDYRAGQ